MKPAEFLVRVLDCPYPNPLPSVVNGYHGDSWESMDFCGISWLPAHLPRPTAHQKQQNLPYTHGVAPRAPTPTRYSSTLTKAKSQHSPLNCSARPPPVACVRFVADHVCIRATATVCAHVPARRARSTKSHCPAYAGAARRGGSFRHLLCENTPAGGACTPCRLAPKARPAARAWRCRAGATKSLPAKIQVNSII